MAWLFLYLVRLDNKIVQKFDGRRWSVPAKVYSRPLYLQRASQKDIDTWLNLLNYRHESTHKTGTYQKVGNTLTIYTRDFNYSAAEKDNAQVFQITFKNGVAQNIKSTQKQSKARLEPILLGGIFPQNNEDRIIIKLQNTPQALIDALIATEDRGYYQHYGISIRGTARALINNLAGKPTQGGSTLTQQLIKNFYLDDTRSYKRKINEAFMAMLLERHYSKDEILQTYLNEINLGQNGERSVNGFGLASRFYFNKPLNELDLPEIALLVGIAKGPSYYNPRKNPERALARRNLVLDNMYALGKISTDDYQDAKDAPLGVVKTPSIARPPFPDFLDIVKRELTAQYRSEDITTRGLTIISTLDPIVQRHADNAIFDGLKKIGKKKLEAALVASSFDGQLLAVVGSRGEFTGFNRAVDAKRQVGSLLKPAIYYNALNSGKYNLASSIDDSPISIKSGRKNWSPKNYGGVAHGQVALLDALANSYNLAAVRIGVDQDIGGVQGFLDTLQRLGISKQLPAYPSTLLGAVELSPMDMLSMYQTLGAQGQFTPIHSIASVMDDSGRDVARVPLPRQITLDKDAVYVLTHALKAVLSDGTGKSAGMDGLAGKTGTTNDAKDAWFAGFSAKMAAVVWVGRDDNAPIGLTGGSGALPIWARFMKSMPFAPINWDMPKGVAMRWLEYNDGRQSYESCAGARQLPVMLRHLKNDSSDCGSEVLAQQSEEWLEERTATGFNEFFANTENAVDAQDEPPPEDDLQSPDINEYDNGENIDQIDESNL